MAMIKTRMEMEMGLEPKGSSDSSDCTVGCCSAKEKLLYSDGRNSTDSKGTHVVNHGATLRTRTMAYLRRGRLEGGRRWRRTLITLAVGHEEALLIRTGGIPLIVKVPKGQSVELH
jgi:hypothetical protein